jgi:NADPH-dependent curcumin reductase CurA
MATTNKRFVLASRPSGEPTPQNFRLDEVELPVLQDGEVLVRHHYLSLDPYMRGRMNEGKSYAQPQALDAVMVGGTVGEVVESRHAGFKAGDKVVGMGGWQQYAVVAAAQPGVLRKIDTSRVPISAYLGAVGMPGVTAWVGLNKIIEAKEGETIVVSAASGAVGGVVGQLAKAKGCRAVGIAGGADKCNHVVRDLGFDACIDYKRLDGVAAISAALKHECPNGIDGYFENVGGAILDAVMQNANAFSRIAMCGMISGYNGAPIPMAAPQLILINRMKVQGFIVSEHMPLWPQALGELAERVGSGTLKYRESVAQDIESAPEAFIGLLKGRNFGKQLVKLV